jgi:histone H4
LQENAKSGIHEELLLLREQVLALKAPKLKEQVQALKARVMLLSEARCEKKTKGIGKVLKGEEVLRDKGGKGLGKFGAERRRTVLRDNIQGITKPSICRLARRGGVKHVSELMYKQTSKVLYDFLSKVINITLILCHEYCKRHIISAIDVVWALQNHCGIRLYGLGI